VLTSSAVLHNARTYTAARTPALLGHFAWKLFEHTPYNPDLAPWDNHLFTYMKNWLGPQSFTNNKKLMEGVKT
jgi:hypothetical protein